VRRIVIPVLVLVTAAPALAGCGWLRAGNAPRTKPDGFVLRGYVAVDGAAAGSVGAPCEAPRAGVAPADEVRVTDPPDRVLASGALGAGVLATGGSGYRCNFPFEIPAVAGGHKTYSISVAGRPAVNFPASELRSDKPAVITVPASPATSP
jgi:hypothetical protein